MENKNHITGNSNVVNNNITINFNMGEQKPKTNEVMPDDLNQASPNSPKKKRESISWKVLYYSISIVIAIITYLNKK